MVVQSHYNTILQTTFEMGAHSQSPLKKLRAQTGGSKYSFWLNLAFVWPYLPFEGAL